MPYPDNSPQMPPPDATNLDTANLDTANPDTRKSTTPFVILVHQRDQKPSGDFQPDTTVAVTPTLRTSGLLLALPPEEVKSLLLMLTFVTPNGWCRPAIQQLADAMRVGEAKARARMQRLQDFRWQGKPLVTEIKRDTGMDGFALSPVVVGHQDAPEPPQNAALSLPPSRRDEIIARSRALYARPRAEVEALIAQQMGWKEQGDSPDAQLRRKLLAVAGLRREQIDLPIAQYPQERIAQQLDWLPYRNAKSPARFLIAAIENDYDAPPAIRSQPPLTQAQEQQADIPEVTLPTPALLPGAQPNPDDGEPEGASFGESNLRMPEVTNGE